MIHLSRVLRSRRSRNNRRNRSKRPSAGLAPRHLTGESLETRTLLSITWTGGGDGTSWNDAANWGGTLPGANDNVVIPAGFNVVHSTGSDTIHNLQSASALTLSGGTLTVGTTASPGTVEVDDTFKLSGGTLADADIKPGSGGQGLTLTNSGGTLDHVTADANLDLSQGFNVFAFVSDGLTLNGTATLGDTSGHYGTLNFLGSQTLGGTGSVLFSTSTANSVFVNSAAAMLTIGPGMTVHGQSGSIDGFSNTTIANQGKIVADTAGGTIQVQPSGGTFTNSGTVEADTGGTLRLNGTWSNTGTLNLNGGTLDLGGTFTTAGIGTLSRAGGTLNLVGALDNTGATVALDATTGPWQLLGGTIKNGNYTSTGANQLVLTNFGGTLDGLTANGDLDMTEAFNVYAFIQNGLTLNGAATLGSAAGHYATMYFLGSETLGGSGSVTLANASSSIYMDAAGTLTIGPGITIHGQSGNVDGLSTSTIVNRGKIAADNSGGTIQLAPGGGAFTNQGTLEVDAGATLQLNGTWSSTGTMNLNGGTLILGGNFTTAGIGNLSRAGGTLKIAGTLDNTAATLALNAATGPWLLAGGTVKNGTYTNVGGNQLVLTNFGGTLDGLTANGDLDMSEDFNVVVFIKDGVTLNGAATLGSAAGHYATMYFLSSETLGGSGSVTLANASSSVYMDAAAALTIGPAMTIHGQSGSVDGFPTSSMINQGKIAADTAGGTISIQPSGGTFTNQGKVETDTGAAVQIGGTWSNAGTLVINRGTLNLGGTFTTSGIGTMLRNGGTVNITGTLDNTGSVLSLNDNTGSWQLMGGTIKGGTYASSLGASLVLTNFGGTLDGLTANGDLDLTEGFSVLGTIIDGLTLNGIATLGSGSGHYASLYFSNSETLGGTGSVVLADPADSLYEPNNATTLTVGPNLSIHGRGSIDGQTSTTIVNQGRITAEGPGTLSIQPSGGGFVNQGTVRALRGGTLTVNSPQLAIDGSSSLVSMPSGTVAVRGNLTGTTTNATLFTPYGTLLFNGSGTAAAPQTLEAMSDDLGAVASAFNGNFAFGKLTLQPSTYVKLVDQTDNAPGTGAEAVYVNSLSVPGGTTLDLNGLHLYARSATINGTVLDGTVTMAPAPSTITWTGTDAATSTNWSDPKNWSTGTVPAAGDTVIFDGTAQNSLATVDAGFSPGGPLADIQVSWGGEITINPGVNLTAFNVEFGGGTLDGTGTLTVRDSLIWSAGTMSGGGTSVVAETASLLINDASDVSIGSHTLNNFGAAVFTGARWDWSTDGVFNNKPGATFDMQSDAGFNLFGASAFNNAGTFTRSAGTGTVHIGPAFNNSGSVDVKSGVLSLDGGGTSTGVFTSESGASLNFGGATHDLSAPSTQVFGAGTVGFTGATVTIGGGYAMTGTTLITSGEVDFNHDATSATTVLSGGNLGGTATFSTNGSFEWSGGTMLGGGTTVIPAAAALTIDDPTDITLGNRTLNNFGSATFTGVRWDWNTGSVFSNESGATFGMQSDANYNIFGASTFNNAGTFTKSIGTATTHVGPAFNNSGSVDVKSGTLSLEGGGTSSGSFTAETGAALDFGGGTHDLSASTTSITGAGTVGFTGATVIIGGTYTVTGTTSISGGEADFNHDATSTKTGLSGGNLGGTATFTTNGSFEWSGGNMLGGGTTVIPVTATLTIDDPSDISLGNRALNNFGSATFTGVRWDWNTGAVFTNESGATFDMQSDANYNVFGTSAFNNAGTFTKSIGTGTTHFAPAFNNSGTVDVKSGTLSLDGGGTSSGAFTAENGAELDFGGGTHDLSSANSSIGGAGTVGFTGATVIVGGTYTVTGTTSISGGEVDFNHDATSTKTTLSGGNLGGTASFTTNGSLEWSGGNMLGGGTTVIPVTATLTIDDPSDISLGNRALNNFGSATFTGVRWEWNAGSVFNNESGATFEMQSDASYNVFGTSAFNNAGTFTKSIGTATTHVSPAFNNSGSVDVKSGTLSLEGGGTSSGSFTSETGATLDFGGGTHDLSATTTSITGAGTIGFTGATVIIGGTYTVTGTTSISGGEADFNHDATSTKTALSGGNLGGTATFTTNGSFEWSGGNMLGGGTTVIPAAATLTIDDPSDISLANRALNNFGSATFTGVRWDWNTGAVFNNEAGATFDMRSDASYNVFGASTLNNAGTFTKSIGTATTDIGPEFSNTGTVDVKTGTLSLDGGFTQTAGVTILDGGAIQNASALSIEGGMLSGSGTVTGDVDNGGGTLSPGFSPGTIDITGNYTQGAGGTLAVEIGGLTAGTDFDVLNVSGTANLDGTLAISLINNFLPAVGDPFKVVTYGAKNGQFAQYTGLDSGNNRLLSPNYFPTNLTLVAGTELTATGTPIAAVVGQAFTGMVATVTDADTNDTAANLTATIDWGDGSSSTGTVSSNGQGGFDVSGLHTYTSVASGLPVSITISDQGGSTVVAETTADVGQTLIAAGRTFAATEGLNFSGTVATAVDPTAEAGGLTATIDWGDGNADVGTVSTSGNGFSITGSHIFAEEGTKSVTVVVQDLQLTTSTAHSTADISDASLAATATTVAAIEGTTFSGTLATLTDANPSAPLVDFTAQIDWGDGTTTTGTVTTSAGGGLEINGSHLYAEEGTQSVLVTVDDIGGATVTVTSTVTIDDATLAATGAPITTTEGATFSGAVATFTDANPGAVLGDYTAEIAWGDGATTTGSVTTSAGGEFIVNGSHMYADEATQTVTVTVSDQGGATAIATTTATVGDATLAATGTSITTTEGATYSGTVAAFTDANPGAVLSDYTAEIAWGDGATTSGTVTTTAGGGLLVNGSHAYAEEGTKTVTVTVSDQGGATASATTRAAVGDATLAATGTSIATTEGATFSGTVATFTDANSGAPVGDYSAQITWGDGTTTSGTIGATQGGFLVTGNHSYTDEGTQTATVTIRDAGGAKATATTTATIADATLNATGTTITTTEGATFSRMIATLVDANSGAPLTDYTVQIAWGDGATTAGTVTTSAGGGLMVMGSHSYVEEGTQPIHITITDDGTASATATTTANIADATLTAADRTISATEGVMFSGTIAMFTDANFGAPLTDYSTQIVWGDGATTPGTIAKTEGGLVVNGSHSYAEEGTQTIRVILTDAGSASATATSAAVVSDATINATGTTIAATAGTSFSGTVAAFTDANPAAPLGDFTAQIDWGDGATTAGTVAASAGGGFVVSGEHTYTSNGNLPLVVMIHDTGGSQATATGTAQVTGSTTETLSGVGLAVSGFELSPLVNVPVATFTSSNPQEPASAFTVTIHWGDGSSSPGAVTLSGSQYTITGSHAYGDEGSFTAKIDVADSLTSTNIVTTAKIAEELLADGTAGNADQRFISEIFRDVLGRQAEPQGRDFWTSHLQGGDNRTKVVQDILADTTEEYHSDLIQAEFQRYLHRAAEPKAVHDFSALLDGGADSAIVDTIIASSPEYFALHGGSNDTFLDALFADALHRSVDPGSRPFYDDLFAKGANRAVIADIVFASDEYHRDLVEGWFAKYLDRAADPTGLASFTAQLDAGTPDEHVVAVMLASDEFLAKIS